MVNNYIQKLELTTDEYIKVNYDGNLSTNENYSIFSEKIGISKTYFYNIVSINKLNSNTDWIHKDD